ncbi:choice-of-anchor I family protein [Pseudoflavonifractor phocaeensis]|uniref:choice-of-anchor I family protein n=1 Tax=Pseudoflavonifractor phocaeensis TaxID=1870988 RepID=UPI001959ED1A|nr:choice-of-anchor I family protein [Pseudoflavonifractor phocaeensis]MBM6937484.1 choice-of-anchor I family protein [Pseudoflavonifractor phocaeensis]
MKEVRRRPWGRRCAAAALTSALVLGLVPTAAAQDLSQRLAETLSQPQAAADWKFGRDYAAGSIADGTLVIPDQSGNGNDLQMQTYGSGTWTDYLSFSDDSMTGEGGSLIFNGDSAGKTGADFITVDGASINSEEFENGYTMEFLYYFPEDWTAADSWMSLIGRQGTGGGNPEGEQGTMYASISNCKEIQFITGNADGDHSMSSAAWSVSMDEGGVWYHIAIVSDGQEIATYVNGCEAFRDYVSDDMAGMYADPEDGRFRVGSSWWEGLDKFLQGGLQEIRICGEALEQDQWLVPNPEDYVEDFGSNETYTLRDEDNYNFVLIPDTQNTVEYRPDVMDAAIDELIASVDALNIKGVIHLGDVVDDAGDARQYNNAKDIFYQLPEAGVKFLVQPGNHDNWAGNGSSYWHYFGQDSKEYMSLTSSYLTPKAWSGAMFVEAGSYTYLILSLACEGGKTSWNPTSGELEWFESMLQQYPNCPTIVTRHDIQNCSDTQPSAIQLSGEGEKLWDIVKKYPQVFMMVGGHSHGSGVEVLQNDAGQDVISILTDLQFSYNGGNGWFRYLEFDEDADKIYYSVYSPYAASLDEDEKTFFDVNFLTGPGHEGEISIDFDTRFAGMANEEPEPETEGKWMTGEYHTHTLQSNDASEPYMTVENALNAAFREDLDDMPDAAGVDNLQYGDGFDYLMLADHLRNSPRNPDGSANETARWSAIGAQQREIEQLQIQGKYDGKLLYSGFEWDMMALDHATVGLMDESGAVPIQGIRAFEWLFSYDTSDDRFYGDEAERYGERQNDKNDVNDTYAAVEWVAEHYPDSFILPNHPSRHNNGDDVADSGEVTIEQLRIMNDIAPGVVFGFEGMPGNQLDPSCELPADDLRAGADEMISVTGGVWDALLSEGRRFYNFVNSDFHFKISSNEQYSSGYWASEFSRNYTWVEPGDDRQFTFSDVVEGMRSGNSYAVNGELISDLSFTVSDGSASAAMGQELNVTEGTPITVTIRFQVPAHNNYQSLFGTDTGLNAGNTPQVDHVDLIMGHVTGKVDPSQYGSTANTDASIVRTFSKDELAAALGEDGYYTLTYTTAADGDLYFRVRGLSSGEVDQNGDPVTHERTVTDDRPARFDYINDYNYTHLSFYANPVWVTAEKAPEPQTQGEENGSASLDLTKIAGYTSGAFNVDGGVMEIVACNAATGWAYAVNGQSGLLTAISLRDLEKTAYVDLLDGHDIDIKAMVETADPSFTYGDMTSVAVSPDGSTLAAALQAEGYADPGRVALFTCNADGSLTLLDVLTTGVQPDMVTFADNDTVLTADEGEPRQGYGDGAVDPKGSVTVIDVPTRTAVVVDFTSFDDQRDSLASAGIVLKKDTVPSVDLEPEYIAVAGGRAYITLQENNAIAVLDLSSKTFTGIYSAGFEDYSVTPVDIDKKDNAYSPQTYESLMGIRMPDGIAAFTRNGKTYLLTANEGDSREWGDYLNEDEVNFGKEGKTSPTGAITAANSGLTGKVVFFRAEDYDGLNPEKDYLFGGRSFTLYEVTDTGIQELFTSGDDFEALTARYFPDYFNASNDNAVLDDRSGKKGPEAESVTVGAVDGRTYAFVALERTGGVMVYDVTDPAHVAYVNYINSRDFASIVPGSQEYDEGALDKWVTGGDVAPEGLAFVPSSASPTGQALLLAACEVSGTVAVYELTGRETVISGFSPDRDEENEIDEPDTPLADQPFTDVAEDHWAREAIGYVVSAGLFQGTSQTTFSPEMTTTRGMLMTVLARMDGTDTAGSAPWYQTGMEWAVAAGVSDGTNPAFQITREQLAAMLYRYARYQGHDVSEGADLTGFGDRASVSSWAADAMAWAVGCGLIQGKDDAVLDPQGSATRAEAAQLLTRFCQRFPA